MTHIISLKLLTLGLKKLRAIILDRWQFFLMEEYNKTLLPCDQLNLRRKTSINRVEKASIFQKLCKSNLERPNLSNSFIDQITCGQIIKF